MFFSRLLTIVVVFPYMVYLFMFETHHVKSNLFYLFIFEIGLYWKRNNGEPVFLRLVSYPRGPFLKPLSRSPTLILNVTPSFYLEGVPTN